MRKVFICIALIFIIFLGSFAAASSKENKGTSKSLFHIRVNGKWGYIDKIGKFAIKPQFFDASSFSGGIAQVMIGDELGNYKWGYIDKTGRFIWSPTN